MGSERLVGRLDFGQVLALVGVALLVLDTAFWVVVSLFAPEAVESPAQFFLFSAATFAILETFAWLNMRRPGARAPVRVRLLGVGVGMLLGSLLFLAGAALFSVPGDYASVEPIVVQGMWVPLVVTVIAAVLVLRSRPDRAVGE